MNKERLRISRTQETEEAMAECNGSSQTEISDQKKNFNTNIVISTTTWNLVNSSKSKLISKW